MTRKILFHTHRWLGIAFAAFMVPAALTGSVLVWRTSIDQWLNPSLFTVPSSGQKLLGESDLADRLIQQAPGVRVRWIEMPEAAGRSAIASVSRWPHAEGSASINEVFMDPTTAAVLGIRSTINPGFNRRELVAWIRRFHYTLMLRRTGMLFMGAVALAWLLENLVGMLLTLPRPWTRLGRWGPAWRIRGSHFNFDLHRAGGLWLSPVLLVLALSSVYLNLAHEVFVPAAEWLTGLLLPKHLESRAMQAILEWQYPAHTGELFGLTGRIVVCIAGVSVAVLAVTGIITTSRKLLRGRA